MAASGTKQSFQTDLSNSGSCLFVAVGNGGARAYTRLGLDWSDRLDLAADSLPKTLEKAHATLAGNGLSLFDDQGEGVKRQARIDSVFHICSHTRIERIKPMRPGLDALAETETCAMTAFTRSRPTWTIATIWRGWRRRWPAMTSTSCFATIPIH